MENIVTVKELANLLKLTEATIYKLVSSGELPGFKIGDSWRFDIKEVLKLIKKGKKPNGKNRKNMGKETSP
jgi:excisionase family DNA binding protein